jgi:hypothetical protein
MDGLSVAASVAGIIWLGIQATQSLVDFYSAHKTQRSNVAWSIKKLEHLLGVLEILRDQLTNRRFRADEQDLLTNIERCVQICEALIQELQQEAEKFKDSSDSDIRVDARTAARRVAYPFRQSTLHKLDESIDEIASHILLALQVLRQKDVGRAQDVREVRLFPGPNSGVRLTITLKISAFILLCRRVVSVCLVYCHMKIRMPLYNAGSSTTLCEVQAEGRICTRLYPTYGAIRTIVGPSP